MKKFLLVILILLIPAWVGAANYYVDKTCTNGLTTYNPSTLSCTGGTDTVYSSLANLNSARTGDQSDNFVYLRKGQIFYESMATAGYGTNGHPYTIGAFGTGANPIISGSKIITSWSHVITDATAPFYFGEDFNSSFWAINNGITVTSRSTTDPVYGETMASTISTAVWTNNFNRNVPIGDASTSYTTSIYAKAISGVGYIGLKGGCDNYAIFNLSTGAVTDQGASNTGSSTEDIGGGWYRFSVTCVPAASGSRYFQVGLTNAAGNDTGNSGSCYAFGFLVNSGTSPVEYSRVSSDFYAAMAGQGSANVHVIEKDTLLTSVAWNTNLATTYAAMTSGSATSVAWGGSFYITYIKASSSADLWSSDTSVAFTTPISNNGKSYVRYQDVDVKDSIGQGITVYGASAGVEYLRGVASRNYDTGIYASNTSTLTATSVVSSGNNIDGIDSADSATLNCWYCRSTGNGLVNGGDYKGDGFSAHGTSTINQYYCLSDNNYRSGRFDLTGASGVIYNSTFVNNGNSASSSRVGLVLQSNGPYTIKNNIIYNDTASGATGLINFSSTGTTSDYNLLYNSAGGDKFSWGGTTYSWVNYKTNSSQDGHSYNSDPLFTSSSDFTLKGSSPGINTGVNLCATLATATDIAGNSACSGGSYSGSGSGPEIGAYEYIPSATGQGFIRWGRHSRFY